MIDVLPRAKKLMPILACLVSFADPADAADKRTNACNLENRSRHTVSDVDRFGLMTLSNATKLRLRSILLPNALDVRGKVGHWALAEEAAKLLNRIVAGRDITIARSGRVVDRYGHINGYVFVTRNGHAQLVQGLLVEAGLARTYSVGPAAPCLPQLLALEAISRRLGRGIWQYAAYQVIRSGDLRRLNLRIGTFQIVAGRVWRVSFRGRRAYLNFGRNWRRDFTVVLNRRRQREAKRNGLAVKSLEDKRVRVRGWLEARGGPLIALDHGALIEALVQPRTYPAPAPPNTRSVADN